ncbi:MAG: metallopeptidase [bacterium]
MSRRLGLLLSLAFALTARAQEIKPAKPLFDPVEKEVEGWKVWLDPALLSGEHAELGRQSIGMLANHLHRIKILVDPKPLADLQKVGIWLELDNPRLKTMQYHPSREWLVQNGHDPRLARKVHITQARQLLSREQMLKHPAVVLHELAHAYHDQFLSFDEPRVIAAYESARKAGKYENVLLYTGKTVKHYGLTNHKEYFAEATEAYFYRNDFYPFLRAELAEYDPEMHALLGKIWEAK